MDLAAGSLAGTDPDQQTAVAVVGVADDVEVVDVEGDELARAQAPAQPKATRSWSRRMVVRFGATMGRPTTTAVYLEATAAELGERVLLVDADPQGSARSSGWSRRRFGGHRG